MTGAGYQPSEGQYIQVRRVDGDVYTAITSPTPIVSARGMVRCGSFTSPPKKPSVFQPSYAQKAAIKAVNSGVSKPCDSIGVPAVSNEKPPSPPKANPKPVIRTIATSTAELSTLLTMLP